MSLFFFSLVPPIAAPNDSFPAHNLSFMAADNQQQTLRRREVQEEVWGQAAVRL